MSKKQWSKPEPDWLPLRQAPFALFKRVAIPPKSAVLDEVSHPEPIEGIGAWWATVEKGDSDQEDETSLAELEQTLAEKSGADRAEIDPKAAKFSFSFGRAQTGGGTSVIGESPWVLLDWVQQEITIDPRREAEDLFDPRCITPDDETAAREEKRYRAICRATGLVWRQHMLRSLDRAVARGTAVLIARPKTVTAPLETLPADVWPLLRVIDRQNGAAAAPDGTVYWSTHVRLATVNTPTPLKDSRGMTLEPVKVPFSPSPAPSPSPLEVASSPISTSNASGRPSKQRIRVEGAMRDDIRQGRLTPAVLRQLLEKELKARYSASRDTCRKARNNVLSEIARQPVSDN